MSRSSPRPSCHWPTGSDERVHTEEKNDAPPDRPISPPPRRVTPNRPPAGRAERFTPELAGRLAYTPGLSPRRRPAERLRADEWWVRDLADELGVAYHRLRAWVENGCMHVRRVGSRRNLMIWADAEERERLGRLRDDLRPGRSSRPPVE